MYVCVCNAVTDSEIRKAVREGVRTLKQLRLATGCCGGCGQCESEAAEILQQALPARGVPHNLAAVLRVA